MMDAGSYCASMLRMLSGAQPQVTQAHATLRPGSKVNGAGRSSMCGEWCSAREGDEAYMTGRARKRRLARAAAVCAAREGSR